MHNTYEHTFEQIYMQTNGRTTKIINIQTHYNDTDTWKKFILITFLCLFTGENITRRDMQSNWLNSWVIDVFCIDFGYFPIAHTNIKNFGLIYWDTATDGTLRTIIKNPKQFLINIASFVDTWWYPFSFTHLLKSNYFSTCNKFLFHKKL